MDDLIEEILAEMPDHFTEGQPFIDLDSQVPHPVRLPAGETWVEILNDAKTEFEVDGVTSVFSTWRVEAEDPLDIGDIKIVDGMHARTGRLALDACMADQRATQIFAALPEGKFRLRIKFLREPDEGDWVVEDKFDPVRAERKKGQGVIEITRDAKPGDLPTSDSDAASWAHIVHLVAEATTNNGTVPEGPLYLTNKRYVDEKDALCVLKSGDTMTGKQ